MAVFKQETDLHFRKSSLATIERRDKRGKMDGVGGEQPGGRQWAVGHTAVRSAVCREGPGLEGSKVRPQHQRVL